jgi:hypothetical protein
MVCAMRFPNINIIMFLVSYPQSEGGIKTMMFWFSHPSIRNGLKPRFWVAAMLKKTKGLVDLNCGF